MAIDLTDPQLRILECVRCAEPVAARPDERQVFLSVCPACGVENRRDLGSIATPEPAHAHGYRSAPGASSAAREPFARPSGAPRLFSYAKWRVLLPATLQALATAKPEERATIRQRLFWLQLTLVGAYLQGGDVVRARAALESALEEHEDPVLRGLVLTRLARIATTATSDDARAGALAQAWLAHLPPELEPELAEDVWLTRAMIARLAEPRRVLEQLDARRFGANGVGLATALRADALERLGDLPAAYRAYRAGARGRGRVVNATFTMYRLAPVTHAHARGVGVNALLVIVTGSLYVALALLDRSAAPIALAMLALFAGALAVRLLRGPRP